MFDGTTILAVRRGERVVIGGDGQVSMGQTIIKSSARKVRRIADGRVIAGFAGSTSDALTLFEMLEAQIKEHNQNLLKAAVELARQWRGDKYLRRLEAMLLCADRTQTLLLSGTGDVLAPDEGIAAIGSGGSYALAAARALIRNTDLDARTVCERSLRIAAEICVYTNDALSFEEL